MRLAKQPDTHITSMYGNRATPAIERLLRWPAVWLLVCPLAWLLGVASLMYQPSLWSRATYWLVAFVAVALVVGASCCATAFASRRPTSGSAQSTAMPWTVVLAAVLSLVLLAFASSGLRATYRQALAIDSAIEGKTVLVRGRVSSLVHGDAVATRWQFDVSHLYVPEMPGGGGVITVASPSNAAVVDGLTDANGVALSQWQQWPAKLSLSWYHPERGDALTGLLPDIQAGQEWELPVRLKAPHGKRNPTGFDWELHAWSQGLQAVGYVSDKQVLKPAMLVPTGSWGWLVWRDATRQRIAHTLSAHPRVSALISALVVGDQQAIASADWHLFRDTGIAHLVSISGLHITMFAWLAHTVLWWLWRVLGARCMCVHFRFIPNTPAVIALCAALLATAYALFSGWGVPAQRTALMLFVWVGLKVLGSHWSWPVVWLWVLAIVVAWDPWSVLSAGFWLSFVAVAVLLGVVSQPRQVAATWLSRMGTELVSVWRVQWRLSVVLAPLTWLLFGQVSVVGVAVNLLAIPLVSFVVLPLGMLGLLFSIAWSAVVPVVHHLFVALEWAQQLPWAVIQPPALPMWLAVVVCAVVFTLAQPWSPVWRAHLAFVCVVAVLYTPPRPGFGAFELLAFDVGQGSAVLVRTHAHTLLFDAGPSYANGFDTGSAVIVPHLMATGDHVDAVVLSHADNDHVGGGAAVLASGVADQAVVWSSFAPAAGSKHRVLPCYSQQTWRWDGVLFEWVHPTAQVARASGWPPTDRRLRNAHACVLRVSNHQGEAWLMADVGVAQETQIMSSLAGAAQPHLPVVLVAGHHGSATSSSERWLRYLRPNWVLVQAGYRNQHGHPSTEVVQRLDALAPEWGMQWRDTVRCGAALWRSSDPQALGCERQATSQHWHHRP